MRLVDYFNPRSPCGERRACASRLPGPCSISIHALLAESDHNLVALHVAYGDFNPRSPCGERLLASGGSTVGSIISIHALLAESDADSFWDLLRFIQFQSTLSLRRATRSAARPSTTAPISIHALLAESDTGNEIKLQHEADFNPRSPCGERQDGYTQPIVAWGFQSTLSLRRATVPHQQPGFGGDDFNPRSPCGERQQIPPNWPYRFCLKCQFKDGEKSKKAKGSASAQASSPAYEKNKVRIPWGDFECFRFAPIK